ncbi:MAG: hypothetical protein EZS28_045028 [Streblomastix strix]|uniref:Uncharacterized protein n=1 Tax=Streblomastix strix TaxID=222440 RepID=A0A5J4TPX1_9EUKA|nr:MAG: hypothetical protein EZS28_045028 [Streblomastix strix]
MRALLGRPPDPPADQRLQQQLHSNTQIGDVACPAAMIQEDPVAVQRFFLTIHHAARIIAGDAQQRRELTLVNEQIKEDHAKSGDTYSVLAKLSKYWINEQVQINKVILPPATHTPETSQFSHKQTKNKHRSKYSPQIRSNFKYQTAMEANLDMSIPNNKQELHSFPNIRDSGKDLSRETIIESLNLISSNNINTLQIIYPNKYILGHSFNITRCNHSNHNQGYMHISQ